MYVKFKYITVSYQLFIMIYVDLYIDMFVFKTIISTYKYCGSGNKTTLGFISTPL